jgi:hypothetical protein
VVAPPVVTPPVDVPTIVLPVVVPPIVVPPVVAPPEIALPVVTPPGEAPLVAAPLLRGAAIASSNATLVGNGGAIVPIALAEDTGLSVLGTGVSLPAGRLGEAQLVRPLFVEQRQPAEIRVAPALQPRLPAYPPKQDRN